MSDEPLFPGFDTPHYTQVPNTLFDVLLAAGTLTEAELRVLLYICRRTFGFGKTADAISLRQFTDGIVTRDGRRLDHGAGIQRKAAGRAVAGLERKGIILATRHASPEHGDETTVYRLRWRGATDLRQGLEDPPPRVPSAQPPESSGLPQNESVSIQSGQEGELPPLAPHVAAAQAAFAARLAKR